MKSSKLGLVAFTTSDVPGGNVYCLATVGFGLLLLVAACGFPRPADVGNDASADSLPGSSIVHVSPSGNDASDGRIGPVRTLKRAIAIAGTNTDVRTITMDVGRYMPQTGETFPYVVPNNVTIIGQSTGGTILAGTRAEDALTIDSASLRELEFEDFMVALSVAGQADLQNIHIRTSKLAVRQATSSKITANNLEIIGAVDVCGSGLELNGSADLIVSTLISRNLITTINAKDISTLDVTNADITADPRCAGLALSVKTSKMFMLKNSSIVGTYGAIQISGTASSPAQAMIIDTTVSNSGIASTVDSGPAILTIIGGKIFNNMSASQFRDGKVTLKNVRIEANGGNGSSAIYVSGSSAQSLASLVMRGCTVVNNRYGIAMFDYSAADLGTDADPGNNVFQDNQLAGVTLGGIAGPQLVNAVGNTWNPMTQGSDALGKYPVPGTVAGPIQQATGNNYDMWAGLSLRR